MPSDSSASPNEPAAIAGAQDTQRTVSRATVWWSAVVIVAVTLAVYFPALSAGFIWDDGAHITQPTLRALHGLWRIWFEPGATQQYYPLLHTTFWLEHRLWGDSPLGYHLANILLHAGVACLFLAVLRRLAIPGAFLAALIFAVNPVHVESVAWITEQKNTLSAVFYLSAALVFFDWHERSDRESVQPRSARWYYLLASFLFLLALLTKTVTATLPAALLVLAWWRTGRLSWHNDIRPLLPWFVLGAAAGLFTAWAERKLIGAEGAAFDLTLLQRVLLAGRVVWFYLGKLLWPANLSFVYPRWSIDPARILQWIPVIGGVALTVLLWRPIHGTLVRHVAQQAPEPHRKLADRKNFRAPLAVWLLFVGTLFPVLGFLNVYPFIYSFVADHFQYLASLSVLAFAAAGLTRLTNVCRLPGKILSTLLVAALGVLTWMQSGIYHDNTTLFRATIARNPECWMALNNLGKELLARKSTQPEAVALFERALELHPVYAEAQTNLGLALTQVGRPGEAIPHLKEALRLEPRWFQTYNNLGIALASRGRPEEALTAFETAAEINPSSPNIQENWGKALLLLGRRADAAEHFAQAARLKAQ